MKGKFQKSPGSTQQRHCYEGEVLWQYKFGKLGPPQRSRVHQHLKTCGACRDLYLALSADTPLESQASPELSHRMEWLKKQGRPATLPIDPKEISSGQVWTTAPPTAEEEAAAIRMGIPVLILYPGDGSRSASNRTRAMTLSHEIGFHLEGETFLLEKGSNFLGYPALVELFNEIPVPAARLMEYRGKVPEATMNELRTMRESRWGVFEKSPGKEFSAWKTEEIAASAYLSAAVTAMLWDDDSRTIYLQPYRIAADSDGLQLGEIQPWRVADAGMFSLWVIQIRDMVMLRFHSERHVPETLTINEIPREFEQRQDDPNAWEAVIGLADSLAGDMTVSFSVAETPFVYHLRFASPSP